MAQLERTIVPAPAADQPRMKLSHLALVTIGLILFIGAASGAAFIGSQAARPSVVDTAAPPAGEVVDGWMPAISAANRAAAEAAMLEEARRTRDGWSSALLKPEPEVVDGWSTRYGGGGK